MIKIENIYYMLSYAYRNLRESDKEFVGEEKFENAADLLAAILAKGMGTQIKRGIQKDYIKKIDTLRSPKGKIDVSTTISKQLMTNKQVVCEYDEYSVDILMNKVLKSTAYALCRSEEVSSEHRKALKRSLLYLNDVSYINIKHIPWKDLKYHRNNTQYRFLMNICYLVAEGLVISENGKSIRMRAYVDDQLMSRLYEKFLLEYFRKHYPIFKVTASFIDWKTDDGMIDFLPQMRSDVTIKYGDVIMIIDAKYYSKTMQGNQFSDSRTIHSNNLYQIFTYVKNKAWNVSNDVMGMLLYAKTDEVATPNEKYEMSGNTIYVRTLDLGTKFHEIEVQIGNIARIIMEVEGE
jgi:5-methylcytosine-specific restriction enzyme subunit McrC